MRNLTMMTDLYQFTMMYGYYKHGKSHETAVYDVFFRKTEQDSGYAVCAGLEQVIELINNIHFSEEDISYLRSLELFDEEFLDLLKDFRFTGEIYAMEEGTVVFPQEPLLRVKAPICQAQLVETAILTILSHQTLIATKASKVVYAAQGDSVLEFGLRRAQGPDAGIYGARAAIIGGCDSTSNVLTGQMYGIAAKGTHAHSWVMSFPDELSAFRAYADTFPTSCMLLVDTYDTIHSGIPNAITVFNELRAKGCEPVGIRLDSGDLAYLSKVGRRMLDDAGFPKAKIFASSDLDENIIADLKAQGARIDVWGVGTKMITSENRPALGGVYKLSAIERNGVLEPRMKFSDNVNKMTNPGYKKVVRLYGRQNGMAIADLIALDDDVIDDTKPLTIFDPLETWKSKTVVDFYTRDLLKPIFIDGKQVYETPSLSDICAYEKKEIATFWDECKRLKNPHIYKVDLSDRLFELKKELVRKNNKLK